MEKENVKPIVLTNTETNETYTLEFTRDTVKHAERQGFDIDNIDKAPLTMTIELFYLAFRAHHKNVTREKAEKILFEDLGGVPDGMLERLIKLYALPFESLINNEGNSKNAKMTVQF